MGMYILLVIVATLGVAVTAVVYHRDHLRHKEAKAAKKEPAALHFGPADISNIRLPEPHPSTFPKTK